jgi:hypothetical protein
MKHALSYDIAHTAENLIALLSDFTDDTLNKTPFEGSWTAGQVGDHIGRSLTGILHVIEGNVRNSERPINEKCIALRDLFLNFSIPMQSPPEILPTDEPLKKNTLLLSLETTLRELRTIAENRDLAVTCLDFELPMFGPLTRYEWLSFMIYHTQRHIQQLKKISLHFQVNAAA